MSYSSHTFDLLSVADKGLVLLVKNNKGLQQRGERKLTQNTKFNYLISSVIAGMKFNTYFRYLLFWLSIGQSYKCTAKHSLDRYHEQTAVNTGKCNGPNKSTAK